MVCPSGWKPIPRQAGSPTHHDDRLEAYPTTGWLPVLIVLACLGAAEVACGQAPGAGAGGANAAGPAGATVSPSPDGGGSEPKQGFFSILFSGGWVGFLIIALLFGISLLAAYLVFEQAMTLRRNEIMPDGLGDKVRQQIANGRLQEAEQACRSQPSFLSFVLLNGLAEVDGGWTAVEKSLEDATAEQSARLFRKVEYLSVIGNIAPMVGLLGTVTGMIFAFQRVASTQGAAGAADLAEGIYQALVTTVGGLLVAIPSLAAFAILRNRVDQLVAEAAYLAQHACSPLKRFRGAQAGGPPPPPPVPGA